jgi:predicted neutral ceramidase superfamily lipid hydrolase
MRHHTHLLYHLTSLKQDLNVIKNLLIDTETVQESLVLHKISAITEKLERWSFLMFFCLIDCFVVSLLACLMEMHEGACLYAAMLLLFDFF